MARIEGPGVARISFQERPRGTRFGPHGPDGPTRNDMYGRGVVMAEICGGGWGSPGIDTRDPGHRGHGPTNHPAMRPTHAEPGCLIACLLLRRLWNHSAPAALHGQGIVRTLRHADACRVIPRPG